MSATLAVLLHELDPKMRILIVEKLDGPGLESSSALNNAGTGHAANCELNYTPLLSDGSININKAISINLAFERSLELWGSLTSRGTLCPDKFLHVLPHISFVEGDEDVSFLRQRFEKLSSFKAFSRMKWSNNLEEIKEWMPLIMEGRSIEKNFAATRIDRGTDVDFGALTFSYLEALKLDGSIELKFNTEVKELRRYNQQLWHLGLKAKSRHKDIYSSFVFIGAGGGALPLLQKSGITEALNYGGFPVSGQWLVCSDSSLTSRHNAKVYGRAKVGSPPMSVPHLDSRWINGNRSLLFGPFAGFSSKFLKNGSRLDLIKSVNISNLAPMMQVGFRNLDLVTYLLNQLRQADHDRLETLKDFLPNAKSKDWTLSIAGQRVQIIKRTRQGGILQMGTEVVSSADGTLAALLGASPGASTAVTIMLEVLERCWASRMGDEELKKRLKSLLPTLGEKFDFDGDLLIKMRQRNDSILGLA